MNAEAVYAMYAQESFQNSFDHGFWEGGATRSKGEMVMLIVSELGECQEADRKSRHYNGPKTSDFDSLLADYKREYDVEEEHWRMLHDDPFHNMTNPLFITEDELFSRWFDLEVKDTAGDELADVAIGIMDYVYGWRCHFSPRDYRKVSTGNFSHDLLRITWYVLLAFEEKAEMYPGKDWAYALEAVCRFADWWSIDLEFHIENKQRYNRSRPAKHGKLY